MGTSFTYYERMDQLKREREADEADRKAASASQCDKCKHWGMRLILSREGNKAFRCPTCGNTEWL